MTPAEREERILSLAPQVRGIAAWICRSLARRVPLDDLISVGWLGAIDAVDHFEPDRGVPLRSYAAFRIRGEIRDYQRRNDPLTRDHRRLLNQTEAPAPVTYSLDGPMRGFRKTDSDKEDPPMIACIADHRVTARQAALEARIDIPKIYRRAYAHRRADNGAAYLNPRNVRVLERYMRGSTMKEVAQSFGINESRVSQICSKTLLKLRAAA